MQAPEGEDGQAFLREQEDRINALVYGAVSQFGGSISAEHGISHLKVDTLEKHKPPVALDLMWAIKRALNPVGTPNPKRVVRVDRRSGL